VDFEFKSTFVTKFGFRTWNQFLQLILDLKFYFFKILFFEILFFQNPLFWNSIFFIILYFEILFFQNHFFWNLIFSKSFILKFYFFKILYFEIPFFQNPLFWNQKFLYFVTWWLEFRPVWCRKVGYQGYIAPPSHLPGPGYKVSIEHPS
jgi:hypothetical protein